LSHYERHIFFCTNRREGPRPCCQEHGADQARQHAKARVKAAGAAGPGAVRVNSAGCMDRCEEGPVAVVYPDGVWYTYTDTADIDEIVDEHLLKGRVVERLRI
jgi:(2Fe-2S) ferredoxin